MTEKTAENLWKLFWFVTITPCIGFLIYLIIGMIKQPSDVLVKETDEYLYYKEYSLYGKDSIIYRYHKPIIYDGIVIDKSENFVGLAGKGGHWEWHTDIRYNNDQEYRENGSYFYNRHEIGDIVKIRVSFYPYKTIKLLND